MRLRRLTVTAMLVLIALACVAPAAALASGPSAGDQQYTDPLGGSNGSGSKKTTTTSSQSSSTPSSSPAPSTAGQASSAPAVSSGSGSPPVATASSSSSVSSSAATSTLPRTGFDLWLGASVGIALLGAGITLRRRTPSS